METSNKTYELSPMNPVALELITQVEQLIAGYTAKTGTLISSIKVTGYSEGDVGVQIRAKQR
jgi:hypothetical protein